MRIQSLRSWTWLSIGLRIQVRSSLCCLLAVDWTAYPVTEWTVGCRNQGLQTALPLAVSLSVDLFEQGLNRGLLCYHKVGCGLSVLEVVEVLSIVVMLVAIGCD